MVRPISRKTIIKLKTQAIEIDNITQRKICILGGTGSGKTTTLKYLAFKAPINAVYVFDALNVIRIKGFNRITIKKSAIAKAKSLGSVFNTINPSKIIFAFDDMLQPEIAEFMDNFLSSWKPKNCIIAFDEIHEFTPELSSGNKSSVEVERLIRHGRNYNIGFIFDSQRPAMVKKNVIALTDYLILYRITWLNDLDVVKGLIANSYSIDKTREVLKHIQRAKFLNGYSINFI